MNALRAFEALARHLSYQAAAAELSVTPAAVKQLVTKLEAAVGAPLVRREGRALALTARGRAGQEDLVAAMAHMAAAVRKMRRPREDRRLIATVESSFATMWLVPKLAAFRAAHPSVSVLIDSSTEIVDLARSEADIAIRYGVPAERELVAKRLFDDRVFPVCSPTLAAGPPPLRHLDDLKAVPLIHFDLSQVAWATATQKWFLWKNWLAHLGAKQVASDDGLYFNDYGQAVQAAIAGQGVVLASGPILREEIAAGLLVRPFAEEIALDIGYDVMTTRQAAERPEVAAFIAWILETAAENRPSHRAGDDVPPPRGDGDRGSL
ncbi:MAG: LysR substrate-binding domain-containing protein [Pseudomonadota bacterium]